MSVESIKPISPSCERNQEVILEVLKRIIKATDENLLEIGSGTGQHAVFMAPNFKHLTWHTSDLLENHAGINQWLNESKIKNITQPKEYEAGKTQFPTVSADIVYTANTLHIMSWAKAQIFIKQLANSINAGTKIIIYGPFNYNGQFTSDSNADFDIWLKERNSDSGIRDFESVVDLMFKNNIKLVEDIEMPANNRILYFAKIPI